MADKHPDNPIDMGILGRSGQARGVGPADVIAIALSLLWLGGTAIFFLLLPANGDAGFNPITFVMTFLAIVMPVALFWVAASAAKSARVMREESARLQAAIDAMRHTYIQQQQTATSGGLQPAVAKKLDEIAASQKQAESAIATFATTRDRGHPPRVTPTAPGTDTSQPSLALGTPAEEIGPPLPVADFIRAMNFPENAEDREGFRALRRALEDRMASKLIRSAQDVLTLLSEDGIYMDDLRPDRARPEVWRKFAGGERGPTVAALGGVRDRSCLALTAGRMRQDPIFRDAAHHFLRQFDRTLIEFESTASDKDLNDMAETRTARAFMLLGRVTGTFD